MTSEDKSFEEQKEPAVLVGNSKKRPTQDGEEISIDLSQAAPLSKKQKRLLRKGKITLDDLEAKQREEDGTSAKSDGTDKQENAKKTDAPAVFGVWIGNMSFDTAKEDLIRFITLKTEGLDAYHDGMSKLDPCKVEEKDIVRIKLPTQEKSKKIKGFAYVDFATPCHQLAVIQLSESNLNGRKLLIKDSKSYEGRPTKEEKEISKNPPSRILFVGNLSFDTTEEMLTQQFQHCGEITRIRMATFQDTGKCKGFAFIDFKDEQGPTTALRDKSVRRLLNKTLRMEYGEDRSKRAPKSTKPRERREDDTNTDNHPFDSTHETRAIRERSTYSEPMQASTPAPTSAPAPTRQKKRYDVKPQKREKSSVALKNAQRQSAAIVESKGKKTVFE